jgi:hypothetical protein
MDQPTATTPTSATWTDPTTGRTITIDFEYFARDDFRRPTRAYGGAIVVKPAPSRDSSLLPLAVQDADLWGGYKEGSFEGGHIIALGLGGPDHPCNIAPMSKGSNCGSGIWGKIEWEVKNISKQIGGGVVAIDLTLVYNDNLDPRIPERVRGSVGAGLGMKMFDIAIRPPNDVTNILTPKIKSIFSDIKELAEDLGVDDSNPHARLDVIDRVRHPQVAILNRAQDIRDRIRLIPILASYPSGGIGPKQKKGKVLPVQRLLMMLHNRYLNGGLLMAEDTHNLGLILREWQAQADHIRPYVRSKDSSYRNLRLMHHRTNNKRGAKGQGAGGQQKRISRPPNRYRPGW